MATFSRVLMVHPALPLNDRAISQVSTATPTPTPTLPATAGSIWQNPMIALRSPVLAGLWLLQPDSRSAFSLPTLISPTATPNDQTLFDEPQPGGPQHYLPQYRLATTGSGNQEEFAVTLAVSSSGYLLTIRLNDFTDMGFASGKIPEFPTTVYILSTVSLSAGIKQDWNFPDATVDGTSITLMMPIVDDPQTGVKALDTLQAIYRAMTDSSQETKLILRRSPALALPQPLASAEPGQPPPPQLYRASSPPIDSLIDFHFDKDLPQNQNVFAGLPKVGGGTASTLNKVMVPYPTGGVKSYPYWQNPLQPAQIYFLPDSYKIARLATSPHTPAINISTSGSDPATLNVTLTFIALPVWDPNRITAAAATSGPLNAGFALPSGTNLSLSVLPATNTQLLLNLPSNDTSASNPPVPISNAQIDTASGIQASVTLSLPQFQQVYNAMFVTPSVLLSGQLNVTVDQDTESASFSGRASDFAGAILDSNMKYDPGLNQLTVTATNAIESPIHVAALPVTVLNGAATVQANVVSVNPSLPADLQPAQSVGSAASGTTSTSSSSVAASAPASTATIVLQLPAGTLIDNSSKTQFDLSQVTVTPDSKAIWEAIVQNQVVAPVTKQITVQLPASVFPASSGSGAASGSGTGSAATTSATSSDTDQPASTGNSLLAVQVVFDNGQTVTFQPSMTAIGGLYTQTIGLKVSIEKYVLGLGDSSNYTYRVDTITASGIQHGSWTTTNVDDLFVTLG